MRIATLTRSALQKRKADATDAAATGSGGGEIGGDGGGGGGGDDDEALLRAAVAEEEARAPSTFGISLQLFDNPMLAELWRGDVDVCPMMAAPDDPEVRKPFAAAARRLQIFLDLAGLLSADPSPYMLDPDFGPLLSEPDARVVRLDFFFFFFFLVVIL